MAKKTTRPAGRLPGLADTLDAHGGFAEVVASLRAGHGGTIGGTWGSASALTAAAVTGKLVVVLPHADEADAFAGDLALFTTRPVALLPALESLDDEAPADDPASAERLAVVKKLTADAVASRHAVDYGIGLRRLESSNAVLTTTGAIFFEWLRGAARLHFKAVQKFVLE